MVQVEKEVIKEAAADSPLAMAKEVIKEVVVEKPVVVEKEVVKEVEVVRGAAAAGVDEYRGAGEDLSSKTDTSVAAQNRIIVHTAHAVLVVNDVADAIDQVDALAR